MLNIIQIYKRAVRIYGPDTDFGFVCSDLDLEDMTLGQGHYGTLGSWTPIVLYVIQIEHGSKKL